MLLTELAIKVNTSVRVPIGLGTPLSTAVAGNMDHAVTKKAEYRVLARTHAYIKQTYRQTTQA